MGTERNPNTGLPCADADTDLFAMQIKTRLSLPGWLWAAVDQARGDAGGKVPIVVLSEVRPGVKARRLVVVEWGDWLDLHGPAGTVED